MFRCLRKIGAGFAPVLAILLFVAPQALAGSAAITVDGNISDLQTAINANLGPANGGLILPNTPGQIGTPACAYFTNGYDLKNVYFLLDFKNPDGSVDLTPDLFIGWETLDGEVIGDTDSDGDPNTVNQPISPTGCIVTGDGANISATEEYILLVDFDCGDPNPAAQKPFIPEVVIRITNNAVFAIVNGNLTPINDATFSHRGPSTTNTGTALQTLEARVPDFSRFVPQDKDLCDATVVGGAGNTNEALGEPRTAKGDLNIPPRIAVTKTPPTQALCVGDNANWTLQACNTGLCSFQTVKVRDTLPAGMSYVSATPTPSNVNGQVIEWTFSNVEPGQCTPSISLTARLDECLNPPLVNSVVAIGTHAATGCHEAFDTESVPATAEVTCNPEPCIDQVSCSVPTDVCVGQTYRVTGRARNCSPAPEDITIVIKNAAGAVIKTQKFDDVPAGQSRELQSDLLSCSTPGTASYRVEAFAENGCGRVDGTPSDCTVRCNPGPCATVTCDAPETSFSGDVIQISGTANNCSQGPATLEICVYGPGSVLLGCETFTNVPSGESRTHTEDYTAECVPGDILLFYATVKVTNDCGEITVRSEDECQTECRGGGSCPRTPGFWSQQCEQRDNGSRKFDYEEVVDIAECIDARVDIFRWDGAEGRPGAFDGFCANIAPPRPMDCKKQAFRHFAAFLANYCAGVVGEKASNGDSIFIDPGSPNPCKDTFPDADNLGELIDEIDDLLVQLRNEGADSQDPRYCAIIACVGGINEGRTIPIAPECSENYDSRAVGGIGDVESMGGTTPIESALELYRPSPNPFQNSTTIAYAVGGTGERVEIGVYNVAGQLVRRLVNEYRAAGRYQVTWDGRGDDGVGVAHGVYFLRAYVGGNRVAAVSRILYLR